MAGLGQPGWEQEPPLPSPADAHAPVIKKDLPGNDPFDAGGLSDSKERRGLNDHFRAGKKIQILIKYSETRLYRTARDRPFLFVITGVRYIRVNLCIKITILA